MTTTLAEQFSQGWENQTKTISASRLAKLLDPTVKIERNLMLPHATISLGTIYRFSDGSVILTNGRGRNFTYEIHDGI